MTSVDELVDWHGVFDLSLRYAEAIDTRNWPAFRAVFTDSVRTDFTSFTHAANPPQPLRAEDWVAMVRGTIDGFVSTQHLIGNQRIAVTGDTARYTAYVQAQHWMDTHRWYLVGGWYDNEAVRVDGDWKLASVTLHQSWDAGDRSLLREAARRVHEGA